MKKNNAKILLFILLVPIVVFALETSVRGSVDLTMGKHVYSDNTKINLKYPVIFTENNKSKNGIFSSVLSKKGLFSYSDKQRLDKRSAGTEDGSYYFNQVNNGTYRISIIGESGTTKFDYVFTSSNGIN